MDCGVSISPQPLQPYQNPLLRRHNSISPSVVASTSLTLQQQFSSYTSSGSSSSSSSSTSSSSSASSGDFNIISIKPVSYTSLKDLLPSMAVNSPKPKSPAQNQSQSGSEISIKNRLVKQAAWAYLQPMSTSPDYVGRCFLHRLWHQFMSNNPVPVLFRFIDRHIFGNVTRAFDWLFRAIRVRSSR